jgi:protein phosphatase
MKSEITNLFRKSFTNNKNRMNRIIDAANAKIEEERKQVNGGNITLKAEGKLIIVGDLHGDLSSLHDLLLKTKFMKRAAQKENIKLVLLGDYGDRGKHSPEVYFVILTLKQMFPDRILLLRGNHEGLPLLTFSPHDMPLQLEQKYNDDWKEVYSRILALFSNLPHSITVEGKYLLLHGGAPSEISSAADIAFADKLFPMTTYFEDILWSDPRDGIDGVQPSPRGFGKLFGEDVTSRILALTGTKSLIRSHEPCEGVMVNHSGKVLTVFSRNGPPYDNKARACLELDLSIDAKDAFALAQEAVLF